MGRWEAGRKREDRCARMREDGRKKDKEDQNTGGQGTEVRGEKIEVEKVGGLRPLEERFALGWRQKIK